MEKVKILERKRKGQVKLNDWNMSGKEKLNIGKKIKERKRNGEV